MEKCGCAARTRKRYRVTTDSTHSFKKVPNLLNQKFQTEKPDIIWCSDITYIPTQEGWLYLSVIMDLYSRKIIGWEDNGKLNQDLTLCALRKAIERTKPPAPFLHHSDQGI
ncbi:DDE-type integrase/transposase/recombinase [Thermatribacter velox]|uniref:DDE-type integrase/transposase/recombinase n=1 Tax=Thermatribacter velox TaxID=3039681 RepID=A0ABZ2YBA0_9BACT